MGAGYRTRAGWLSKAWLVIAVALVVLLASAGMAAAKVATINVAANTGSDQYEPDIDGLNVVYTSKAAGNNDVYLYNLKTKVRKQLTTDSAGQEHPQISGDNVVYIDSSSGGPRVVCYTISAGVTKELTGSNALVSEVAVDGNMVTYIAQTSSVPLTYVVNAIGINGGPAKTLGTYVNTKPYDLDVAGNYAAYSVRPYSEDDDSGSMNLYLANVAANVGTLPLKPIAQGDSAAVAADGSVVFSRNYGDFDPLLKRWDSVAQTETVLYEGIGDPLGISNGRVLLRDDQWLSVYNVATGTRLKIAAPKNLHYAIAGGISGSRVVWDAARTSSSNGYVWPPDTDGHLNDYDVKAGTFSGAMLKLACPKGVDYNKKADITGRATKISGAGYKGTVTLQRSYDKKHWSTVASKKSSTSGKFSITSGRVRRATYFRVKFVRGTTRATSYWIKVLPRAYVSKPSVPAVVAMNTPLTLTGTVKPAMASASDADVSYEIKNGSGVWVKGLGSYSGPVLTKHSGYSSYKVTNSFPTAGQWRVRVSAGNWTNAWWGYSAWTYFTVK